LHFDFSTELSITRHMIMLIGGVCSFVHVRRSGRGAPVLSVCQWPWRRLEFVPAS